MAGKSRWKSEAEFQAHCTKKFDREYPHLRGRLILQYNNADSPALIGMLISMGMQPGTADQVFFPPSGEVVWIEYKILGKKQRPNQEAFEARVRSWGHKYYLVTEEPEQFFNVINKYDGR